MSWPHDGKPRFVVETVTGFVVNPASSPSKPGGPNVVPPVCFAVLDRAYAHQIVRQFLPTRGTTKQKLTTAAEALAASLNHADQDELTDEAAA